MPNIFDPRNTSDTGRFIEGDKEDIAAHVDRLGRKPRVLVAMSGGVDSSVAAALLKEEGYEVIGATLQLHSCTDSAFGGSCCSEAGATQARAVAGVLGIPHYILDCRRQFHDLVLRYSWREYSRGRTPNPCIICNEQIKFGFLLDKATSMGADRIATGHYVRKEVDGNGAVFLRRGMDQSKDQSYFLFSLDQRQLAAALFPIGQLAKTEVREKAKLLGLPNADREESQDVCFAAEGEIYPEMLRHRFHGIAQSGSITDREGRILGRHDGFHRFTVGQRRGIGVALGKKAWVKGIDPERATVTLALDAKELSSMGLTATGVRWGQPIADVSAVRCSVQVRYRHHAVSAMVEPLGAETVRVVFSRPVRAVTPGQGAVFYDEDRLLGGGWIERSFDDEETCHLKRNKE